MQIFTAILFTRYSINPVNFFSLFNAQKDLINPD